MQIETRKWFHLAFILHLCLASFEMRINSLSPIVHLTTTADWTFYAIILLCHNILLQEEVYEGKNATKTYSTPFETLHFILLTRNLDRRLCAIKRIATNLEFAIELSEIKCYIALFELFCSFMIPRTNEILNRETNQAQTLMIIFFQVYQKMVETYIIHIVKL